MVPLISALAEPRNPQMPHWRQLIGDAVEFLKLQQDRWQPARFVADEIQHIYAVIPQPGVADSGVKRRQRQQELTQER